MTHWLARVATAAAIGATLAGAVACGDGEGGSTVTQGGTIAAQTQAVGGPGSAIGTAAPNRTPSTGGTQGGPEPALEGPAARFTLQHSSLTDGNYAVDPPNTFIITNELFTNNGIFLSALQGDEFARSWGFIEGYQVQFAPDGFLAGVLAGGYYLTVESYLFETQDGARQAYARFEVEYGKAAGSIRVDALPLANDSSAWMLEFGRVGRSAVPSVYHRFLFRRGNLLSIVQTNGAGPFMSIDIARDYAVILDDQALGNRPAVLPTPAPAGSPVVR